MQLSLIIAQLRARCAATFATRVAGAAEFKILPEASTLPVPCAFVIPLDDNPEQSTSLNSVRQPLTDAFAVVVAVSNTTDEKGQSSSDAIHAIRAVLWAALLGWRPIVQGTDQSESRYDGISYEGGSLLALDRARLWYQFEFSAQMEIDGDDGYQDIDLAALPAFLGARVDVDIINPVNDPNLNKPNQPDDRIEHVVTIPPTGDLDQ